VGWRTEDNSQPGPSGLVEVKLLCDQLLQKGANRRIFLVFFTVTLVLLFAVLTRKNSICKVQGNLGIMTEKKDAKITILVVSDPHDDVDGIKLIQNKLSREKVKIDAVFCPGDITTMPNKDYMLNPTKEEIENFTAKAKTIISALGEIPERGAERVFWIPGNHDPVTFFGPPSERQETAEWASGNIHGKVVELAPGLFLGGWGGCVEAFEDGKEVWKAYPYPESEVRRRLAKLEKELESTVEASRQNLILMTHSGPHLSSTAQVTGLDPNKIHLPGVRETIINSGSPSLTKLISKQSIQV